MLRCDRVRVGYKGSIIIEDASFSVKSGEVVSLIGLNGSGKSTIFKAIMGMLPLLSGSVFLDGMSVDRYKPKELAQKIAFLPQVRNIPNLSVEKLVQHGRFPYMSFSRKLTNDDRDMIERAMDLTNVNDLRKRQITELSGGERQRAYIAMVIAQGTELVLLDEPATYLDVRNRYELMKLIQKLQQNGISVLMALHDLPDALAFSSKICILKNGCIDESSTPQQIIDSNILYDVFGARVDKAQDADTGAKGYCLLFDDNKNANIDN